MCLYSSNRTHGSLKSSPNELASPFFQITQEPQYMDPKRLKTMGTGFFPDPCCNRRDSPIFVVVAVVAGVDETVDANSFY